MIRYFAIMKHYIVLLCLTGVPVPALLQPVGHNYYLITTKVTWPVAPNYCRETYDDLATVESDRDWLFIKAKVARQNLTEVAWVGLYNDIYTDGTNLNGFHWSYKDVPLNNHFQHWPTGQPDFGNGLNTCGYIGPAGYWWLTTCTRLFPFICFNAGYSYANKYVGITTAVTWIGALAYCRRFHTDLAFLGNLTDNDASQNIASLQSYSWVGIYRNTWKFSDGTQPPNLLWLPVPSTNSYLTDNCAVLNNGIFTETKYDELHYFICHITYPVRTMQIMKLQVMSDMSIFDPNVQSAILELVKKKVDENGMLGNTTITWKVQSDGQVFQKKQKNF